MSHTYTYILSKNYESYTLEIYCSDNHTVPDPSPISNFIDEMDSNLNPRQITETLFGSWPEDIFKLDIFDNSLNIILSTEIDPEVV
jgi:hypothetical protein